MADQFSPIEDAGGWWQLRRSYGDTDAYALWVKRKRDGKAQEIQGTELAKLIDVAVAWCNEAWSNEEVVVRRVKKPKKKV